MSSPPQYSDSRARPCVPETTSFGLSVTVFKRSPTTTLSRAKASLIAPSSSPASQAHCPPWTLERWLPARPGPSNELGTYRPLGTASCRNQPPSSKPSRKQSYIQRRKTHATSPRCPENTPMSTPGLPWPYLTILNPSNGTGLDIAPSTPRNACKPLLHLPRLLSKQIFHVLTAPTPRPSTISSSACSPVASQHTEIPSLASSASRSGPGPIPHPASSTLWAAAESPARPTPA